jgi:hypothetical protein
MSVCADYVYIPVYIENFPTGCYFQSIDVSYHGNSINIPTIPTAYFPDIIGMKTDIETALNAYGFEGAVGEWNMEVIGDFVYITVVNASFSTDIGVCYGEGGNDGYGPISVYYPGFGPIGSYDIYCNTDDPRVRLHECPESDNLNECSSCKEISISDCLNSIILPIELGNFVYYFWLVDKHEHYYSSQVFNYNLNTNVTFDLKSTNFKELKFKYSGKWQLFISLSPKVNTMESFGYDGTSGIKCLIIDFKEESE